MTFDNDAASRAQEPYTDPTTEEYEEYVEASEQSFMLRPLNFTDGFQFGCGFWLAGLVALTLFTLGLLVLNAFFSLLGFPLFG